MALTWPLQVALRSLSGRAALNGRSLPPPPKTCTNREKPLSSSSVSFPSDVELDGLQVVPSTFRRGRTLILDSLGAYFFRVLKKKCLKRNENPQKLHSTM
eukprot:GHVU01187817.1.p3 GENE.GHVU01187817.1~~GHVU01187817.1.p3  ORF type:complete len:100 (-),score=4.21 GHVU01187817.1:1001-1300(-)